MDFVKWYKNKIESNDLNPPEFIWENIQDELDIHQSWQVINNHLEHKNSIKRNRVIAIAASLLIFISAGTYWILKPDAQIHDFQELTTEVNSAEKTILESKDTPAIKIVNINTQSVEEKADKNYLLAIANEQSLQNDSLKALVENTDKKEPDNYTIDKKLDQKIVELKYSNNELRLASADIVDQQLKSKREAFTKLYIGATGQLANTWLLNEKTYSGMESSSLTSSNASFGSNFGIYMGTNLTKKLDIQLDFNFLAQNNQNYNEYINWHYVENRMRFNYSQLAISFRYSFLSKRFVQGEHGINLGGYVAYLNNAYQTIDGQITNLTSTYNSFDYGICLSYEYVFPVYKQLGVGTGLRAYYGLKNIFAGDEYIPAYLNETKNASVNLSLSVKYLIK